jgi:tetratricopeptide (TPR) repeat protein
MASELTSGGGGGQLTAAEYLKQLLDQGNECFAQGDARGAIRRYDSALTSFVPTQHVAELRPLYQRIWSNKAMAHQQLKEYEKMREAAMVANSLLNMASGHNKDKDE